MEINNYQPVVVVVEGGNRFLACIVDDDVTAGVFCSCFRGGENDCSSSSELSKVITVDVTLAGILGCFACEKCGAVGEEDVIAGIVCSCFGGFVRSDNGDGCVSVCAGGDGCVSACAGSDGRGVGSCFGGCVSVV